uniref:(northern house mosquito) hypothetical protein n=1 Tax=Culex pipiens TaxID=7175 RepID=A0A8D8BSV3_CULPI
MCFCGRTAALGEVCKRRRFTRPVTSILRTLRKTRTGTRRSSWRRRKSWHGPGRLHRRKSFRLCGNWRRMWRRLRSALNSGGGDWIWLCCFTLTKRRFPPGWNNFTPKWPTRSRWI